MNRDELKAKATELGIQFPSNVKTDKLAMLIAQAGDSKGNEMSTEVVTINTKETHIFKTSEYAEYSKKNGTVMGRKEGTKTKCSIEELRVLINSDWTPVDVIAKHGMSEEEHKQLVWELSKAERREKAITFSDRGYKKG